LAINPNTVARAYQQLQAEEILETIRGQGLEVKSGAIDACREERRRLVGARVASALAEARRSGLQENELRALIEDHLRAG
jgi:GntR family transcriptional regulator